MDYSIRYEFQELTWTGIAAGELRFYELTCSRAGDFDWVLLAYPVSAMRMDSESLTDLTIYGDTGSSVSLTIYGRIMQASSLGAIVDSEEFKAILDYHEPRRVVAELLPTGKGHTYDSPPF